MKENRSIYRILDASLNRSCEGLRTLEEASRFILDCSELACCFKELRHQVVKLARSFPRDCLLRSRDTESDVGTNLEATDEYARQDLTDVVAAAASRVQQSLRVLEEYGKVIDPTAAKKIEQIRYRLYTASAKLELSLSQSCRRQRIRNSFLYVLVDAGESYDDYENKIRMLADSAVDVVQLRDRSVSDRALLRRAQAGVKMMRDAGKLFIVNDRVDLAIAADADGVHVGQDELPVQQVRQIIGENRLVGVSTHHISEAKKAVAEGADYLGCGPVFPSRTKSFERFPGINFLSEVAMSSEVSVPCFAIGGIEKANLGAVLDAGFYRIAVAGALSCSQDLVETASFFEENLRGADPRNSQSIEEPPGAD